MDAQNTAVTENAQTESEKTGSNSAQAEPQTELVTEPAQEEMRPLMHRKSSLKMQRVLLQKDLQVQMQQKTALLIVI